MQKIYVAPVAGRSMDIPEDIKHLFQKEECEYRSTCSVEELETGGHDFPENFCETFKDGREIVKEKIINMFGEEVEYVSWDHPGFRYFFEIDEINEVYGYYSTLNINSLSMRSADDDSDSEFVEIIFGEPTIEGWFADLISE